MLEDEPLNVLTEMGAADGAGEKYTHYTVYKLYSEWRTLIYIPSSSVSTVRGVGKGGLNNQSNARATRSARKNLGVTTHHTPIEDKINTNAKVQEDMGA